ncbi:MAG: SDR family NAD(P)-dependent oxidoreductase, partial [Xanthomonadales bacterium]|nr:SDR family NAD(P)-dependent oxidoreductase [Xanthomonadales bacterium]
MSSAVVIGANRGVGLAITRMLLEDPGIGRVIATHRDDPGPLAELAGDTLLTARLDVTNAEEIDALASLLEAEGIEPDLVLHCAGILHEGALQPEKSLRQCEPASLARLFAVNSIAPLMVSRALLPRIPRRASAHFAVLSAMVRSIGDNRLGGWYGYRASKAALNQFMRTLAVECRRTHPGLCITAIHPGTTDT